MISYSTTICSHQVLNPCSNLSRMLTAESVHQEWTKDYQQILDKMTRDIWPQRSHIMAPLTALTSVNVAWKWTPDHQKAFDEMKRVYTGEAFLAYHISMKSWSIVYWWYTDQLLSNQERLNIAQTSNTATGRVLNSIVEALKELRDNKTWSDG